MSVTIFGNFRINNEVRLNRMRDSFQSFKEVTFDDGLILLRGELADRAAQALCEDGFPFEIRVVEDHEYGWIFQTFESTRFINTSSVFIWLEDHILVSTPRRLEKSIEEFEKKGADFLVYSFWLKSNINDYASSGEEAHGEYNKYFQLTSVSGNVQTSLYVSTLISVMSKRYFDLVLFHSSNGVYRWPHQTPFNFEKMWKDKISEDVTVSYPREELFVSIDDDFGIGYSAIARGLYKPDIDRDELRRVEGLTSNFSRMISSSFISKNVMPIYQIAKALRYTASFYLKRLRSLR